MNAFKTVRDFAAKELHQPDSQRHWKQWSSSTSGKNDPEDNNDEIDSNKRLKQTSDPLDEWKEIKNAEGRPYWFNASTGETRWGNPHPIAAEGDTNLQSEDEDEDPDEGEEEEELATRLEVSKTAKKLQLPAQEWEKSVDSLTRKAMWYCAEIDAVVFSEPLPPPWRAAKDPSTGLAYYYSPETNETRWS